MTRVFGTACIVTVWVCHCQIRMSYELGDILITTVCLLVGWLVGSFVRSLLSLWLVENLSPSFMKLRYWATVSYVKYLRQIWQFGRSNFVIKYDFWPKFKVDVCALWVITGSWYITLRVTPRTDRQTDRQTVAVRPMTGGWLGRHIATGFPRRPCGLLVTRCADSCCLSIHIHTHTRTDRHTPRHTDRHKCSSGGTSYTYNVNFLSRHYNVLICWLS